MRSIWLGTLFAACALGTALPGVARADEPWLLGLEADLAVPTLAPTSDLFHPGAAASVSVHRAFNDWFLLGLRLRGGFLSDGPPPADRTRANPGIGDLYTLGLSVRFRPLSPVFGGPERATGLFVEVGGGGALTGGLVRPMVEGALGWGFAIGDLDLAPVVRWTTVIEVDNQLDGRPGHVLLAGLELTFFDARDRAQPDAPEAPRVGDRDGDTIPDRVDGCTDEPEDFDGFEDGDGCPEADNDADGILDPDDRCPLEPEDRDGFFDEDGCPERDNDNDGFLDPDDACPNEAEVINGVDDRDGCPDVGLITMADDRIILEERVLFDLNRARVKNAARPVLQAIVALYRQHPEWVALRIEGHADEQGTRAHNQRLSELRARQVREVLIELGVRADVIDSIGYGETRPFARGRNAEQIHQANRRVEFVVLRRRQLTPEELAAEEAARAEERGRAIARQQAEAGNAPASQPDAGEAAASTNDPVVPETSFQGEEP